MKKKLVLKIGTSTLTNGTERIKRGKMEDIAQQLLWLQESYDIVLVSSGAVAAAKQTIRLNGGNSNDIAYKQALAAIGQPFLMKRYQEVFSDYNLPVAQCLLTYRDVHDAGSIENILNTFQLLWQNNYIPIINENDTVATEEIKFGDNDKLAALVAILIKADLLVLASDMNGLYDRDPKQHQDAQLITLVNYTTLGGSPTGGSPHKGGSPLSETTQTGGSLQKSGSPLTETAQTGGSLQQSGSPRSETTLNPGEPPLWGDPPSFPAQQGDSPPIEITTESTQTPGEPPLWGDPPSVPAQGTGGIQSKLIAAELCMQHNIEMWIVNGQQENFIKKAMEGQILFTKFQK